MSVQLGFLFIVAGLGFRALRHIGLFRRRTFYRFVPNFLIANGIGFFIPLPAYQDGLALALVAFVGDELWFYRSHPADITRRWRDKWDKLRGM